MENELSIENENEYSLEWFKSRALDSIKMIREGFYDFSDSLLLYIPGGDDDYEAVQEEGNPYYEVVTAPENIYLRSIAREIVRELPDHFEYVDLGPGIAKKAQHIFDELKLQGKTCIYRPVDISPNFLKRARLHAEQQGFASDPIQSPFETLPELIGSGDIPRFVSLVGLTYANYNAQNILKILAEVTGGNGFAFVDVQIRDRIDCDRLRSIYKVAVLEMVRTKLSLLDLDVEDDLSNLHINEDFEVWGSLKRLTPELEERGLKLGDSLLLFQSLRPTLESFKSDIVSSQFTSHQLLDLGTTFVGALLRRDSSAIDEARQAVQSSFDRIA